MGKEKCRKNQLSVNIIPACYVVIVHSKITFSIARNVIMIGLLSKRRLRDGVASLVFTM